MRHSPGKRTITVLLYLLAVVYAVYMLYPFLWMVIASLKKSYELYVNTWALPSRPQWGNFATAWSAGIRGFFLNSIIVTVVSVLFILLVSSLASYSFARMRFVGRTVLFLIIVSGFLVPVQVTLIPLYSILRVFGVLNTYFSLIGPYVAYAVPFSVLLLTSFFRTIPRELEQAAYLDGCSDFQVFRTVILPLSRPGLATIIIFQGVWIWNEFFFALVFIRSKALMTLPRGLMTFRGEYIADWPVTMAGITIATIPLVLLYVIFQRNFIEGLTAGAVKS